MSHIEDSMVLTCKECGRSYAWDGDGCPHCDARAWVGPPSALAAELQAIVARRRAGEIDADEANRLQLAAYASHTAG